MAGDDDDDVRSFDTEHKLHVFYFVTDQMGTNYGANKITSTQQNPMLSRQLSVSACTFLHTFISVILFLYLSE